MNEPELPDTSKAHTHFWQPAGILVQNRIHKITMAQMQRPSLAMLCPCGAMDNRWVPPPPEDAETNEPPGGVLKVKQ